MRNILIYENFSKLDIEVIDLILGKESSQLETIINDIEISFEIVDSMIYFLSDEDKENAFENNIYLNDNLKKILYNKYLEMKSDSRMKSLGFFKKIKA